MDSIASRDLKPLELDDVLRLAPDMFNPEHAFLPITEEDVFELLQANPTGEIRKPQAWHRANREA